MPAPAWMNPAKISDITIHCSATPRGRNDLAATISAWDTKKFGQVSYHYVIQLDGSLVQTLRHDQRGAHVGGHNTGNIGICYVGGLEKDGKTAADTRTDAQKATMAQLLQALKKAFPKARIRGHRDWSPDTNGNGKVDKWEWLKSCPCFDVTAWCAEIGL
jgi:N-acetyl-anhydromuramyl-L-alanine amidase AmpD